ncbi:MAG: hypothetical protein ACLQT6_04475 [Desulfomonilaceae bacterium]
MFNSLEANDRQETDWGPASGGEGMWLPSAQMQPLKNNPWDDLHTYRHASRHQSRRLGRNDNRMNPLGYLNVTPARYRARNKDNVTAGATIARRGTCFTIIAVHGT